MGVPIASRNIFPSNIQGLPTWFEVRVSGEGHLGRRGGVDLMVAMNPQTWDRDLAEIEPGGYLLYDSTKPLPLSRFREDITVIGVPLTALCNAAYTDPRQRQLLKNIIYVGALSALLDIEPAVVEALLGEQYKGKDKLVKANRDAFHMGRDWALENLSCPIGLRARAQRTPSATASTSTATAPPAWARSTAAPPSAPGTRSRPRPRSPRASSATAAASAPTRTPARSATPSCRRRTSWPPSAWSSAPPGTARAPSPRPAAPASR